MRTDAPAHAEHTPADLKAKVFPGRDLRYLALANDGRKDVRVVWWAVP